MFGQTDPEQIYIQANKTSVLVGFFSELKTGVAIFRRL